MTAFACPLPQFDEAILQAAVTRISYLHPDWSIERTPENLVVHADPVEDQADLQKEVAYTIYREKIFFETLGMRQELLRMVMSK